MNKKLTLFFEASISSFFLGALVAFISNYWKIGEAAFDELLTFDFYKEKIVFSLVFGLYWVFITRWSDKKQKMGKQ